MGYAKLLRSFGRRLTNLRKRRGKTIEKLAYENSLSKGNLSELEKGLRDPRLTTLYKIAHGLEIKLRDLVDF